MQTRSRAAAIEGGHVTYFTGEPCLRGHVAERYTIGGQCCECLRETQRDRRAAILERRRELKEVAPGSGS